MPTELPPSRYRVTERGRRLEVVDTWAGRLARSYPSMVRVEEPIRFAELTEDEELPPTRQELNATDFVRAPVPVAAPRPAPIAHTPEGMASDAPDFLRMIAATTCGDARDGDGRLLLRTSKVYDAKGPRSIALDPDGERELGLAMLVLLIVAVSAIIFAVTSGWFGFGILVVALWLARQARAIATPWLDRLAGRTR